MKATTAASAYKLAQFENAPPLKIVQMMYEGALRFLAQAEGIDPHADPAAFGARLRRAHAVVAELRLCLDHERARELSTDLNALYLFVERKIHDALLDRTVEPLADARAILEILLSAWRSVDVQQTASA